MPSAALTAMLHTHKQRGQAIENIFLTIHVDLPLKSVTAYESRFVTIQESSNTIYAQADPIQNSIIPTKVSAMYFSTVRRQVFFCFFIRPTPHSLYLQAAIPNS